MIRANYEQFEALIIIDLAYFLGTDTKHISLWQVKPDGGKSVVYFRYLFDTDEEDETQIVGGDIMVLAGSEIADDSSTAQRGFLMKYTDASYEFVYCIPSKEECDPSSQANMSLVLLICFLCSFAFEIGVYALYRRLTRDRRQRLYEEELEEQRRILREMNEVHPTAMRVGAKDVNKKRAKKIAMDREAFKEIRRNHVSIDAAKSLGGPTGQWTTAISDSEEEQDDVEMAPYAPYLKESMNDNDETGFAGDPEVDDDTMTPASPGW